MKRNLIAFVALLSLPTMISAQDDDMYFVPKKKKADVTTTVTSIPRQTVSTTEHDADRDADTDYHTGNLRDVDEYNRRGTSAQTGDVVARMSGDTLYVTTQDGKVLAYPGEGEAATTMPRESKKYSDSYYEDNYYDDDFYYATRLSRYHGFFYHDPFFWDVRFGWYDPWYDPWYGYYAPYYRYGYISWYDWGWGWHHHPGWDMCWGHHGYYRDHYRPHHNTTFAHVGSARDAGRYTSRLSGSSRTGRVGRVTASTGRSTGFAPTGTGRSNVSSARGNNPGFNMGGTARGSRDTQMGTARSRDIQSGTARSRDTQSSRSYNTTPQRTEPSRSSSTSSSTSRGSSSGSFGGFGGSSRGSSSGGGFGGSSRGSSGGSFGGSSRGGGRGR